AYPGVADRMAAGIVLHRTRLILIAGGNRGARDGAADRIVGRGQAAARVDDTRAGRAVDVRGAANRCAIGIEGVGAARSVAPGPGVGELRALRGVLCGGHVTVAVARQGTEAAVERNGGRQAR